MEAAGLIGSDQIQGRATLGGNLCNASPRRRLGPPSGGAWRRGDHRGTRRRALRAGFGSGDRAGRNFSRSGRVHHRIPGSPLRLGERPDAYERFIPRTEMDIAVVGSAARIRVDNSGRCQEATVVLAAVAPTVVEVSAASGILAGRVIPEGSPQDPLWDELGKRRSPAATRSTTNAAPRSSAAGWQESWPKDRRHRRPTRKEAL